MRTSTDLTVPLSSLRYQFESFEHELFTMGVERSHIRRKFLEWCEDVAGQPAVILASEFDTWFDLFNTELEIWRETISRHS